jgi:hypothetical protein
MGVIALARSPSSSPIFFFWHKEPAGSLALDRARELFAMGELEASWRAYAHSVPTWRRGAVDPSVPGFLHCGRVGTHPRTPHKIQKTNHQFPDN